MTARTKRTLLLLAFFVWICYTVYFSVVRVPKDSRIDRYHLDIIFHFSAYLVMVILGASLIRWFVVIPALVIAAGTELVQGLLPYRTASWGDLGINIAGAALGIMTWFVYRQVRRRGNPGRS